MYINIVDFSSAYCGTNHQQEKKMVVVVAGLRTLATVVQHKAHMVVVLVSRRGLGGSSSSDCRYCCMGLWLVACTGPLHWLVQPQSLLLKAHLGNVLLGA